MDPSLSNLIIYFFLYAFLGWIIEMSFKSLLDGNFVNSGFLSGYVCPLYGFGALLVIQFIAIAKNAFPHLAGSPSIIINILVAIFVTSSLEYLTGLIMEILFENKWWDYSDERFHLHGRVCIKYSIYWGILAYVMLSFVHPHLQSIVHLLPFHLKFTLAYTIIIYFVVDLLLSANEAYALKKHLTVYGSEFSMTKQVKQYKRLLSAFPQVYVNIKNRQFPRGKLLMNKNVEHLHCINEFMMCINNLITHDSVQMMKLYRHHCSVSCFEHSLNVSYVSFMVCRAMGLDYIAAARGGLLHDLFLYDWREFRPQEGLHGFVHPRLALINALEVCSLNEVEKDIILKHMFPLTWPPPRYKESMVVCLVDSYCSLREIYSSLLQRKHYLERMAFINDNLMPLQKNQA